MAEWVTCGNCRLKHTARADGICPRCKTSVASPGSSPSPAPPAPTPAAPEQVPAFPAPSGQPPAPPPPLPPTPPPAIVPGAPTPSWAAAAPQIAVHAPVSTAPVDVTEGLFYSNEPPLLAISLGVSVLAWLVLIVGTLGMALLYAPFVFLIYLFTHSALIAYIKGTAIKITPRQFPDLHARLAFCCHRLGISPVPDCYLLNGQGGFNAFATRFLGRNFVVLFSDVVDALEDRPGAINFYLGHELAHIQRRHLVWAPVLMPASLLPLLGAAYHRACESTCDRYGAACCADTQDAVAGITALAAGEKRWKQLTVSEYIAQAEESSGFWMSLHELVSDYPWLVKRVARVIAFRDQGVLYLPARHRLAYFFALFIPRTMAGGAGGLMGLMVMVAVIGIIAAIAIPSLLRARVSANEAAAVSSVRTIADAEVTYFKSHNEYTSLACLAAQPGCTRTPALPALLDPGTASPEGRFGYRFRVEIGLSNTNIGQREFAVLAVPAMQGRTGVRSFCGDASGLVFFSPSESNLLYRGTAACNPELSPVGR